MEPPVFVRITGVPIPTEAGLYKSQAQISVCAVTDCKCQQRSSDACYLVRATVAYRIS